MQTDNGNIIKRLLRPGNKAAFFAFPFEDKIAYRACNRAAKRYMLSNAFERLVKEEGLFVDYDLFIVY